MYFNNVSTAKNITPEDFLKGLDLLEKVGNINRELPGILGTRAGLNSNFDFLEKFEDKFETIRKLIEKYKDRDNEKTIDERYDWLVIYDSKMGELRRVETVGELACYCVNVTQEAYQYLGQKQVEKIIYKDKPISKSIDNNTLWTAALGIGAMSIACFNTVANAFLNGTLGIALFVFLLIILNYKKKFFSELKE